MGSSKGIHAVGREPKPLALSTPFVSNTSVTRRYFDTIKTAAAALVAATFVASGVTKLMAPQRLADAIAGRNLVPHHWAPALAMIVPCLWIVAGLGMLTRPYRKAAAWIGVVMLALFACTLTIAAIRGIDTACGCLGGGRNRSDYIFIMLRTAVLAAATWAAAWWDPSTEERQPVVATDAVDRKMRREALVKQVMVMALIGAGVGTVTAVVHPNPAIESLLEHPKAANYPTAAGAVAPAPILAGASHKAVEFFLHQGGTNPSVESEELLRRAEHEPPPPEISPEAARAIPNAYWINVDSPRFAKIMPVPNATNVTASNLHAVLDDWKARGLADAPFVVFCIPGCQSSAIVARAMIARGFTQVHLLAKGYMAQKIETEVHPVYHH